MQESWTRSGVPVPILSPQQLYQQLFVEAKGTYKQKRNDLRNRNRQLLDNTLVMFGSPMGYGGTHSNRNLPILLAGGGLRHQGHVDLIRHDGSNRSLCNLYLSMIHAFGIERDVFNLSNGTVSI